MTKASLEVLVEPFRENDPGPHVQAVVAALETAGLESDMGPFATSATGELDQISGLLSDLVKAAATAGATSIQLRVVVGDDA